MAKRDGRDSDEEGAGYRRGEQRTPTREERLRSDWELVFDALSDSSRRYILQYLYERPGPVPTWELAIALACRTTDRPPDKVDVQIVEQAEAGFVHVHLPKLEAANLVEWTEDEVILTEHAETLPLFTPSYRGVVRPEETDEE
ncbi:ArsR family transcriptional regulator [Haloferax sp. S1W]|uniref:DUF7344 domain-containing protein n=1 Tax=Haloferax sp. S1W TaxID=3377110 RepID=UPI0037C5110A